jgi:hypothetical protein
MNLVSGRERVVPSTAGESGLPAGEIGDVDGDATFVVGGAWGGNWVGLSALTLGLELVEEVLLGCGSPG